MNLIQQYDYAFSEDPIPGLEIASTLIKANDWASALDLFVANADEIQARPSLSLAVAEIFDYYANLQGILEGVQDIMIKVKDPRNGEFLETPNFTPITREITEKIVESGEPKMVIKKQILFKVTDGDFSFEVTEDQVYN